MKKVPFISAIRSCIVLSILFLNVAVFVQPTSAAGEVQQCSCFCYTGQGAIPTDKTFKTKTTPQECLATCQKNYKNDTGATCAYSIDQYPERNLQCFTDEQCQRPYDGTDPNIKKGTKIGINGPQVPECPKGQHYCYPNPELAPPLTLNVAIGELKKTINVGEYINALYYWMIGAGITIAIVMIMIGGLQYVLGAGGGNAAKTAKKRISNAIIGLTLLLLVNLILKTVNPYLIRLQVPQLPMLKTVTILKDNLSCEKLKLEYDLTDKDGKALTPADLKTKKCGESAVIKQKKNGETVTSGSTCDFKKCDDEAAGCLGSGKTAKCLICQDTLAGNKAKVKPSSQVCAQLSLETVKEGGKDHIQRCGWSKEQWLHPWKKSELFATALAEGSCAMIDIRCDKITSCSDYNSVQVKNNAGLSTDIDLDHIKETGDISLKTICEENPCKLISPGLDGKPQSKQCHIKGDNGSWYENVGSNCVAGGTVETTAGEKLNKSGSCDPATCLSPKQCIEDSNGNKGCGTCVDVVKDNSLAGGETLQPTDFVCQKLTTPAKGVKKTKSYYEERCSFTTDSDADGPSCAKLTIDCSSITKCDDYDDMPVINNEDGDKLDHFADGTGAINLKQICSEDPCGAANLEGKDSCEFDPDTVGADSCD